MACDDCQDVINAALESVADLLDSGDEIAEFIRSRIGTNPLAEAQAKIKELNGLCLYHEGLERELQAKIAELESLLAEAYADADDVLRPRIAELEHMLSEEPHNIPTKYVQHGGVTFALHGSSSIRAYEELERELAEARKDAKRSGRFQPSGFDAERWR